MDTTPKLRGSRGAQYCCVCSNYRGKVVDGRKISLHRFSADPKIASVWRKRVSLVRKDFVPNPNHRLCSEHFVGRSGPTKLATIPSLFLSREIKTSVVCGADQDTFLTPGSSSTSINRRSRKRDKPCSSAQQADDVENVVMTDDLTEEVSPTSPGPHFITHTSPAVSSVLLHDYTGPLTTADLPTRVAVSISVCELDLEDCSTANISTPTSVARPNMKEAGVNTVYQRSSDKSVQTNIEHVNSSTQCCLPTLVFEDIMDNKDKVNFYTGIPNGETFQAIFDEVSNDRDHLKREVGERNHLRYIDELFLVLMRLRCGLLLEDLADRFRISKTTCKQIFNKWIVFLHTNLVPLIVWPSRQQVNAAMPNDFRQLFPRTRIVIDCTELFTHRPSSLVSQTLTYSHYKSTMTWKALIGITPHGVLSFVSDLWLGGVSDQQITLRSGLLDKLERGDAIMADKGFDISKFTTERQIDLIIPPRKNKMKKMARNQIIKTRRIASMRIHVERYMARVKKFRILSTVLPCTKEPNKIWKICNALTMLYPPLNPRRVK